MMCHFPELPEGSNYGGQRRTLVENYYHETNWTDLKIVFKDLKSL